MLIQLSVENYRSIKDEVRLNLSPAPRWKQHSDHVMENAKNRKVTTLPIAAIYGANGSGKSNLIKALDFMRKFVVKGYKPDEPIQVVPFKLDTDKTVQEPSRFEVVCKVAGVVYSYGFITNGSMVLEEWLFAYYTNKESKVFERVTEGNTVRVEPGTRLVREAVKGRSYIEFVAQGTRPNQLFLSEAYARNIPAVEPIWKWFSDNIRIIMPNSHYAPLEKLLVSDTEFASFMSSTMRQMGLAMDGIVCHEEEINRLGLPNSLVDTIVSNFKASNGMNSLFLNDNPGERLSLVKTSEGDVKFLNIQTLHHRNDGSAIEFDIKDASDGTKRLLDLLPMLKTAINDDMVFIIDELDRSLHTLLARKLIKAFLDSVVAQGIQSQLIFTTHDTNLLDSELLRCDEIWFMEKNPETQGSTIASLSDFRITDGLNYENGYLLGRFGGIPFFGDVGRLP